MHSSTVTVAVLDPLERKQVVFNDRDFKIEWYSGTGCGGQNRNKVQSSCRITHLPSGLVRTAQTRSRENSLKLAKDAILVALGTQNEKEQNLSRAENRRNQVGSGERGDKRRTYRFQDNTVSDHMTEKKANLAKVMQGNFDLVW